MFLFESFETTFLGLVLETITSTVYDS